MAEASPELKNQIEQWLEKNPDGDVRQLGAAFRKTDPLALAFALHDLAATGKYRTTYAAVNDRGEKLSEEYESPLAIPDTEVAASADISVFIKKAAPAP